MDKVLFKDLMAPLGVPQVAYAGIRAEQWREDRAGALARAGGARSARVREAGASRLLRRDRQGQRRRQELADALALAFEHDELAIVEAAATGIEVECGVLEGGPGRR